MKTNDSIPQETQLQRNLRNQTRKMFTLMGFRYFPSRDLHFKLSPANRDIEIDSIFVFENLILLCEDSIISNIRRIKDELRKKSEALELIEHNFEDFLRWADQTLEGFKDVHGAYTKDRLRMCCIYIAPSQEDFSDEDILRFQKIKPWGNHIFRYFEWLSKTIKQSARYELFDCLGYKRKDIGRSQSSVNSPSFSAPIVYPTGFTSPIPECRVVTFMMSAEQMLEMCYVLRKDGWRKETGLYQRLIDKSKMKTIREYVIANKSIFFNNIIVSLPNSVKLIDNLGKTRCFSSIREELSETAGWTLQLSSEYNSLCIIDGQHRVYAYHEGGVNDDKVSAFRKDRHLLVTGIHFPETMNDSKRQEIQSKIFLDINQNAKPIAPNLLLEIQKILEPLADVSIADDVLLYMNKHGLFENRFSKSSLTSGGLKKASIIKFALRYLVSISPKIDEPSLIRYWQGDRQALSSGIPNARAEYIKFCAQNLSDFFADVQQAWETYWKWDDKESLLPSVVTINGCLIAYRELLGKNGIKKRGYYVAALQKWPSGFSRADFKYRSSGYNRFAKDLLRVAFGIDDSNESS